MKKNKVSNFYFFFTKQNSNSSSLTGMNIAVEVASASAAELVKNEEKSLSSNSANSLHGSHKEECSTVMSASTTSSINNSATTSTYKVNILGVEIIKLPSMLERELRIVKRNYEPDLGLIVDSNYEEGVNGCVVKEIKENSIVKRDNRLRTGDYIRSVNNENMKKITNSIAKSILKRAALVSNDIM